MIGVGSSGPLLTSAAGSTATPGEPGGPDRDTAERDAWTILASIDQLGPVAFSALLLRYGSGRAVLEAAASPGGAADLAETSPVAGRAVRIERRPVPPGLAASIVTAAHDGALILRRTRDLGIVAVTVEDPSYPRRLAGIEMPPHVLFVQGDPAVLDRPRAVAIVGTRRATTGGRTIAGRIATALAAADATVASGLAYGIDGAAHEATIRAGGITVAVIGGGRAAAVPSAHERLARAIVRSGGVVVSESAPHVEPTRGTFPRRNRLISGLTDATVVVEAPARSGALITASWALEQGRECFVVPGGLDAPSSAGCLAFLREWPGAARIVAGVPQLIADLGFTDVPESPGDADALTRAALQDLGTSGTRVATALLHGCVTVDEVVAATDLPVAAVLASLTDLERRGLVVGIHGRYRPAGALLGERTTRRHR